MSTRALKFKKELCLVPYPWQRACHLSINWRVSTCAVTGQRKCLASVASINWSDPLVSCRLSIKQVALDDFHSACGHPQNTNLSERELLLRFRQFFPHSLRDTEVTSSEGICNSDRSRPARTQLHAVRQSKTPRLICFARAKAAAVSNKIWPWSPHGGGVCWPRARQFSVWIFFEFFLLVGQTSTSSGHFRSASARTHTCVVIFPERNWHDKIKMWNSAHD